MSTKTTVNQARIEFTGEPVSGAIGASGRVGIRDALKELSPPVEALADTALAMGLRLTGGVF